MEPLDIIELIVESNTIVESRIIIYKAQIDMEIQHFKSR